MTEKEYESAKKDARRRYNNRLAAIDEYYAIVNVAKAKFIRKIKEVGNGENI